MSNNISVDGKYRIASGDNRYMELGQGGEQVHLNQLDEQEDLQKWNIRRVDGKPDTYRISSLDNKYALSWEVGGNFDDDSHHGYLVGNSKNDLKKEFEWVLDFASSDGTRLTTKKKGEDEQFVDSHHNERACFRMNNPTAKSQQWTFHLLEPFEVPQPPRKGLEEILFPVTVEDAAKEDYDIIIVGSGMGGGILAGDLYDTNVKMGAGATKPIDSQQIDHDLVSVSTPKRILLLEKGGLLFHSHCLNIARAAGLAKDGGQQSETTFSEFKDKYDVLAHGQPAERLTDWKGGAMYNLGGRGAVWGLFAHRVQDNVLDKEFSPVATDLRDTYYDKAESLMMLSTPKTEGVHQRIIDHLNAVEHEPGSIKINQEWGWGRIASEFNEDRSSDRPAGAYSPIDKIVEIAMSRPRPDPTKPPIEHEHFKTVLHADVRKLHTEDNTVTGVEVKDARGKTHTIKVTGGLAPGKVVLAAGSVHSPSILLRSPGITQQELNKPDFGALHLTDHHIYYYQASFVYTNTELRGQCGAMKLQSYAKTDEWNMSMYISMGGSSFIPRGKLAPGADDKLVMAFVTHSELDSKNTIVLRSDEEPKVTITRGTKPNLDQVMKQLTAKYMDVFRKTAEVRFTDFPDADAITEKQITLKTLELGAVAHELGTLPMKVSGSEVYSVDKNLKLKSELCEGVYVCDLSVFPCAPAVNPSLTLAALALRLSHRLLPIEPITGAPQFINDNFEVVNHSGAMVKIRLAPSDDVLAEPPRILPAGARTWYTRDPDTPQGLFVYRLDTRAPDAAIRNTFVNKPTLMTAWSFKITAILP